MIGAFSVAASLLAGVMMWILAERATAAITETVTPIGGIAVDLADSIEASRVIVDRITEAVESIEQATRSTARTLDGVNEVLGETADLAGGGIADSLDSAIQTLPSLISTGRVVDRTMTALSFLGVDYDPEVPLDQALSDLEASLAPIPDQIRTQVDLVRTVEDDLARISSDAGALAAVLLQARIDMMEAEGILDSAAENAAAAAQSLATIEGDLGRYDTLARLAAVATTVVLVAAGLTPLLGGIYLRRTSAGYQPPNSHPAT